MVLCSLHLMEIVRHLPVFFHFFQRFEHPPAVFHFHTLCTLMTLTLQLPPGQSISHT